VTPGERVVAKAASYLWVHEVPWGSNRSTTIDRWSREWGMVGVPWCNIFSDAVYREAGVDDEGIQSPATAITASNGYKRGAVVSYPVVGGLLVWPGTHVAVIERVYSKTTVGTIEGNSGDRVARRTRSNAGAIYIAPRAIRQGAVAPPDPTRIYGFQDPKGAVLAPGAWRTKAFALNARRKLGTLGRRAKVTKRGGKWRILMPAEYRYTSRKDRDRDMALRGAETGRRMRPISRTVTTLDRSQVVTQGLGKVI
jgi:hypothetical protein